MAPDDPERRGRVVEEKVLEQTGGGEKLGEGEESTGETVLIDWWGSLMGTTDSSTSICRWFSKTTPPDAASLDFCPTPPTTDRRDWNGDHTFKPNQIFII